MSASTSRSRSPTSAWEWLQTALLAGNLAWTTLCLGGYRPETMVVTATLTGALLAVHLIARAFDKNAGPIRAHPAGWLLLPFLAYAAINAEWFTPVPWLGWRDWFGWAEMIAVFWVVLNGVRSSSARGALFGTLVALGVVAVLLGCYQRFVHPDWLMLGRVQAEQFIGRASGSFGIPNSLAAFLLLLIPALGALTFRRGASAAARVLCGWLILVLVLGLVLTISRGAWIGLALALTAWPLVAGRGSWRRRFGIAAVVFAGLLMLGGVFFATVPKVRERFVFLVREMGERTRPIMWRGAWQLFREHPATGSGAGSYNVLFEKYRPEGFRAEPQWAHNDYLNTLSDYGAVGFTLFFGACAVIAWRCARGARGAASPDRALDSREFSSALAAGAAAFALQLFVDFHFKIPALAMAFAVVAALVVQRRWPVSRLERVETFRLRAVCVVAAIALGPGVALLIVPRFRAEALRYRARQRIDRLAGAATDSREYRDKLAASRAELAQAVVVDSANAQAWADTAYAAALWAHISPSEVPALGVEAEAAANQALAISPVCAEFWVRRGVARDMRGRWFDGSLDFVRATTLAPCASWAWFYYADHMSRKTTERGLTEAALALCLRLDPQNQDGLALRQRLAISH